MSWRCRSCAADNPDGMRFCGHCGAPASSALLDRSPAARLPEQRRFVTALFADLSGFTTLSEQLDPETLSEIIGEAIHSMSAVVDRYGGTVLNYAGDAVLAGFGIPESAGDDAERALATALDMRTALAALLPNLPPIAAGLTMHIGVNSGHAVARYTGASTHVAYTIVGDAVNTAQRLEAAAPSGEIYVGPVTAELAGHLFELEPVGPITMKGKAAPMEAWRLVARNPTTVRTRSAGPATFVGRADVLADLEDVGTSRRVVALVGEPGIGKTTTVQQARRTAAGARWITAAAVPYLAEPYGSWRTVVRALVGDDSLFDRGPLTEEPGAPAARRRIVHRAVLDTVLAAAPVVVVLDDLQWADPASLDLARELAFELGFLAPTARVGLVVTARPEARADAEQLLQELPAAAGALHLLDGLDPPGIGQLVAGVLGGPPSAELVALVADRTGGSPFFATELTRLLRDRGQVVPDGEGWGVASTGTDLGVPPTVEELVQGRLDRLEPGPRSLIEVAAVIGSTVPLDLLRSATADSSSREFLGPLLSTALLVRDESDPAQLTFRHGIVRDVAYHCTLRGTRRRLHADVADAIGRLADDGHLDDLAHHLFHADAGAPAVDALQLVATRAARLSANVTAVDALDKAVAMAERHGLDAERLVGIRLDRAELNLLLSRTDRALEEFSALAADPAAGGRRAAAQLGVAESLAAVSRFDEALQVFTEMAPGPPASRSAARASILLRAGRLREAADEAAAGLAAGTVSSTGSSTGSGEGSGDRIRLLALRAQALDSLGLGDEALADAEAAAALAPSGDDPGLTVLTLRVLGGMYVDHDRFPEAEHALQTALELARTGGRTNEAACCLVNLGFLEQRRGNLAGAIELDRQCVREFHRIRDGFEAGALANLAHKLADAGEHLEAGEIAERATTVARQVGDPLALADARYAVGRARGEAGDIAGALVALTEARRLLAEIGTTSMVTEIEELMGRWSTSGFAGADDGER